VHCVGLLLALVLVLGRNRMATFVLIIPLNLNRIDAHLQTARICNFTAGVERGHVMIAKSAVGGQETQQYLYKYQ
jgi:hypothetical protein